MEMSPSRETAICVAIQELPKMFVKRRIINVLTWALYWFQSWARSIQSKPPHPITQRSATIILSSNQCLHLHSGSAIVNLKIKQYFVSDLTACALLYSRPGICAYGISSWFTERGTVKLLSLILWRVSMVTHGRPWWDYWKRSLLGSKTNELVRGNNTQQ
jgi:hypothetical protein